MRARTIRNLAALVVVVVMAVSLWSAPSPAYAEGEGIDLVSSNITSEFPEGFRIRAEARGENEIKTIAARVKIGQQTSGVYDYLEFDKGKLVDGELFWRTNTFSRYIPPGTIISYSFEIEDVEGNVLKTETQQFIFHDPQFEWHEISKGPVTVAFHGPVDTRAQIVLDAIVDTLGIMGPILDADTETPIRVTMYNNRLEMLRAQPPRSAVIARSTTTLGQAFSEQGTLLVMGSREAKATASHEVTHILVHRAADSPGQLIPAWLNEGLAEYGNVEEGPEYEIALEFAVATGALQPTTRMTSTPGNPEDLIIFYGQSRSFVQFMIERFGAEKMKELMGVMKRGTRAQDAIDRVYGVTQLELENMWRDRIGAPPYVPADTSRAKPTPIPRRKIGLYSLTPQPDTETVAASSDTPTPAPAMTAPEPEATAPPAPKAEEEREEGGGGSGCSAPLQGGGIVDLTTAGMLLGLAGLRLRSRRRKR